MRGEQVAASAGDMISEPRVELAGDHLGSVAAGTPDDGELALGGKHTEEARGDAVYHSFDVFLLGGRVMNQFVCGACCLMTRLRRRRRSRGGAVVGRETEERRLEHDKVEELVVDLFNELVGAFGSDQLSKLVKQSAWQGRSEVDVGAFIQSTREVLSIYVLAFLKTYDHDYEKKDSLRICGGCCRW